MISILYVLCAGAMTLAMTGWYLVHASYWWIGLIAAATCLTLIHTYTCATHPFLVKSIDSMKPTPCCIKWSCLAAPQSILSYTSMLRGLVGIQTIVILLYTWQYTPRDIATLQFAWSIVSASWLCSCVPLIVSMMQCAMQPNLHAYRKGIFIWLLQDVVLGFFWLELSIHLDDLLDGHDDSEWRTLFMSMISWHIVIVTIHELYFSHLWDGSGRHVSQKKEAPRLKPCFDANHMDKWWTCLHIVAWFVLYGIVLHRLNQHHLLLMGCTVEQYIGAVISIFAIALARRSRTVRRPVKTRMFAADAHMTLRRDTKLIL